MNIDVFFLIVTSKKIGLAMPRSAIVKEATLTALREAEFPLTAKEVGDIVHESLGEGVPNSSIRSSLRLQSEKTGSGIVKVCRGVYRYSSTQYSQLENASWRYGGISLYKADCLSWLREQPENSVHAIVTDPPYGLVEYKPDQQEKLRTGKGGVWRLPPSFDGCDRKPLPRFTTLSLQDKQDIYAFFKEFGEAAERVVVPGANVLVASNPLVSHIVAMALEDAGFEPRGAITRLVQTMRGGDRPKGAEREYDMVSVMPRSQFEPWVCMRKRLDGTVAHNLRKWDTGGFGRISESQPFGDVIKSAPTSSAERELSPHPSLKPQKFMRQIVKASLPLGKGVVLDPFTGGGSTLAASEYVGYASIGIELDDFYFSMACEGIPRLLHYS